MFYSEVVTLSTVTPSAAVTTVTGGGSGDDEVQEVEFTDAAYGTFTLDYDGDVTDPISYPPDPADVEAAVDDAAGVEVTATFEDDVLTVTFPGDFDAVELVVDDSGLEPAPTPVVTFQNEKHEVLLVASDANVRIGGIESPVFPVSSAAATPTEAEGCPGSILYAASTTGIPTLTIFHMNLSYTPE